MRQRKKLITIIAVFLVVMITLSLTSCHAQNNSEDDSLKQREDIGDRNISYAPGELPEGSKSTIKDWTDYPIIAHALGEVDGRIGTNSKEALVESYERGQRVFEVDFQLTSDGCLVCRHDWDQMAAYTLEQIYVGIMSQGEFLKTPICYYYTPLNIDQLLDLMMQYPDMYLVTDSKETDERSVRAEMRQMAQAVNRAGDSSLWDRIVIQIYHDDMYDWVSEETPATNWIYTLYQIADPDCNHIGEFCKDRNIPVVTIAEDRVWGEYSDVFHSYGLKVYAHTINRLITMSVFTPRIDGFYSDIVTPAELEGVLNGSWEYIT